MTPKPTAIARRPERADPVTGSASEAFSLTLVIRVSRTIFRSEDTPVEQRDREIKAAMAALAAFKPADEIEGMLAAQAVALHHAMMELTRRAMMEEQPHQIGQDYRNSAVKLNRSFIEALDALDRKRGKNRKQVVRVERVTVQAGGQAVVGAVALGSVPQGGGRHGTEIAEKPRESPAQLAHDTAFGAVLPPLWREESSRESVPVARDAREGAVPDSRREKHRAANG